MKAGLRAEIRTRGLSNAKHDLGPENNIFICSVPRFGQLYSREMTSPQHTQKVGRVTTHGHVDIFSTPLPGIELCPSVRIQSLQQGFCLETLYLFHIRNVTTASDVIPRVSLVWRDSTATLLSEYFYWTLLQLVVPPSTLLFEFICIYSTIDWIRGMLATIQFRIFCLPIY
jgi:hypothetical protein